MKQSTTSIEEERQVESEIRDIRKQIETEAWQRSSPFFLRDGDKNTSYFHYRASHREKRNKIESLIDSQGVEKFDQVDLMNIVCSYYSKLFSSSRPPISLDLLDNIDPRLTDAMREVLLRPFSKEEIVAALKGIHPGKSPGPDGLPALFYNNFWELIGDEVCDMVLQFLNHGDMPMGINHTNVVLIPKVKRPREMKDFRPISLCSISYKLISKSLANRMKVFQPDIIDDSQSAFIPERLITENILLASELFHFMKISTAHKRGFMALKLT